MTAVTESHYKDLPSVAIENDTLRDSNPALGCNIYSGAGSLARYALDKPAVPASDFQASSIRCEDAFVILKGPGASARLAQLAMTATEIPWFQWYALRLSQLAAGYCRNPARIFTDLGHTPVKTLRHIN